MVARHSEHSRFAGQMNEQLQHAIEQPVEMIRENPMASMLLAFGVGLGVGVLLSQVLTASEPEPTMSERMKRQVYDTVSNMLPPSLLKQFQNYAS
jgi:hypothetical protein